MTTHPVQTTTSVFPTLVGTAFGLLVGYALGTFVFEDAAGAIGTLGLVLTTVMGALLGNAHGRMVGTYMLTPFGR